MPQALRDIGIAPESIRQIVVTHGHYDHLAGAADLPNAPILLSGAERDYLDLQLRTPDIVAASNIRAVSARHRTLKLDAKSYRGFELSEDLYSDGTVVAVPLGGHTPGSLGIFVKHGAKTVFHVGDAVFVAEAAEKGLPKVPPMRAYADHDGPGADATAKRLAEFHAQNPDVLIPPAHDRDARQATFGGLPGCHPPPPSK